MFLFCRLTRKKATSLLCYNVYLLGYGELYTIKLYVVEGNYIKLHSDEGQIVCTKGLQTRYNIITVIALSSVKCE